MINQMEPCIDEHEVIAMTEYLRSGGWLTEHNKTAEFERMIAEYTGSRFCCAVPNGTSALTIALWAGGIGPGDEVLVPNYTHIATANAVKLVGATPVVVDIEPQTLCMDWNCAMKAVTKMTRAAILVSLNGRAPDMDIFQGFCNTRGIMFIEDACQSLGSFQSPSYMFGSNRYKKHLGTFGDIGIFSFSSPKIITTGQGGALVTDDWELYDKIEKLKDWGREKSGTDRHDWLGYNFKFTDLQAVIGIEQMKKLPWRVKRKKEIYRLYHELLSHLYEFIPNHLEATPWFVDIYLDDPQGLQDHLKENGIGSRLVYPPLNEQKVYADGKEYPVSKKYCHRGLWLPSSVSLTNEQITGICECMTMERIKL